jgi:hypothetical protein
MCQPSSTFAIEQKEQGILYLPPPQTDLAKTHTADRTYGQRTLLVDSSMAAVEK